MAKEKVDISVAAEYIVKTFLEHFIFFVRNGLLTKTETTDDNVLEQYLTTEV